MIFVGLKGAPLRRSNSTKSVDWPKLTAEVGVAGLHFHDLRHARRTVREHARGPWACN